MDSLVVDPVCKTKLNQNTVTYRYQYLGKTYYFCSVECTLAFDEEPEKYKSDIDYDLTIEEGG